MGGQMADDWAGCEQRTPHTQAKKTLDSHLTPGIRRNADQEGHSEKHRKSLSHVTCKSHEICDLSLGRTKHRHATKPRHIRNRFQTVSNMFKVSKQRKGNEAKDGQSGLAPGALTNRTANSAQPMKKH